MINPEDGQPFTDAGAWNLTARLLENGHPIEEVDLYNPPGKKAYVLLHELVPKEPPLYIKLELGSGKIIGRSFHLSERALREGFRDE